MKKVSTMIIAGALALGMSGCASYQQGGTVVGGVTGGVIGSQIGGGGPGTVVAVIGGTLLGAFIGNQIGYSIDMQSQGYANNAAQEAFDSGRTVRWNAGCCHGKIVPFRTFCCNNGMICRRFKAVFWGPCGKRCVYGVACKNCCGRWVIHR